MFLNKFDGIVFWEYWIQAFTYTLMKRLAEDYTVIVAIEERNFRGLGVFDMGERIIIRELKNDKQEITALIQETRNFLHVNNSFKHSPFMNSTALILLLKQHLPVIGMHQEQYPWWGAKGFVRRIKWFCWFHVLAGRKIKVIGCTGNSGLQAYRKALVNKKRLFDFIYISRRDDVVPIVKKNAYTRFVFIGLLDKRKSILELAEIIKHMDATTCNLDIIGDGPYRKRLEELIADAPHIRYHGSMPYDETRAFLYDKDVLILPSRFDGWGCVVNEAILSGCRVIVSDKSGSSALVSSHPFLGTIFKTGDRKKLETAIIREVERGGVTPEERQEIRDWSIHISIDKAYPYFIDVMKYYFSDESASQKPVAPWI